MNIPRIKGAKSEVFLRGDLTSIIQGLLAAQDSGGEFSRGFAAALRAVAISVDVEHEVVWPTAPTTRLPEDAIRLDVPGSNFEAALRGLGPAQISALAEIKRAVEGSESAQRQKILDGYLERIRAGWPGGELWQR